MGFLKFFSLSIFYDFFWASFGDRFGFWWRIVDGCSLDYLFFFVWTTVDCSYCEQSSKQGFILWVEEKMGAHFLFGERLG